MTADPSPRTIRAAAALLSRLGRDRSANGLIEFAYALPVFLTLGMYGTELAYMATVNMEVSQIAMALADNASRLGQASNSSVAPTISNRDIDSVLTGAMKQGAGINFETNGRVILSSLEMDPATGRQFIHWQRCRGGLGRNSVYGNEGYGLTGTVIPGLGKTGRIIKAASSMSGVMYVEAYYRYKPLFGHMFVNNVQFAQEAAFIVRDARSYGKTTDRPAGQPTTNAC
jgi:hypothetical protein